MFLDILLLILFFIVCVLIIVKYSPNLVRYVKENFEDK